MTKDTNQEYAIVMENVSKIYKLKKKEGEKSSGQRFYALKDISVKIKKGDVVECAL
mgnify:CR=1 FL=1